MIPLLLAQVRQFPYKALAIPLAIPYRLPTRARPLAFVHNIKIASPGNEPIMLGDFVMEITAMMGICSCSIDEQTHRDWNQGLTGNDSVGDFLHLSFYLTGA